jgi:hypothetical protein
MTRQIRVTFPSPTIALRLAALAGLSLITAGIALMSIAIALIFAGCALTASAAALAYLTGDE